MTERKYPIIVVDSVEEGRRFCLLLNDRFSHIHFMTKRFKSQLGVTPVDDVPDEEYFEIYQYAQKLKKIT